MHLHDNFSFNKTTDKISLFYLAIFQALQEHIYF